MPYWSSYHNWRPEGRQPESSRLANDTRFQLGNDSLRYVDRTGSRDGRPRVLTAADFPAITSGKYHFARKVDSRVDGRLLDLLDERVLYGR